MLPSTPAAAAPLTYTVTTESDTNDGVCGVGHCSLREAILAANAHAGDDTIRFAIGSGAVKISPTTALPSLSQAVTIDGTSQPGYAGSPLVGIAGTDAPATARGLSVTGAGVVVAALSIHSFGGNGIRITGADAVVRASWIGVNPADEPAGNGGPAVMVSGPGARIGGGAEADGNRIAFNLAAGVRIASGAAATTVKYNAIADNAGPGISVGAGSGHVLSRNAVFGNGGLGIELDPAGVTSNDPGDGDGGPNDLRNFPVIDSATRAAGQTTVSGTVSGKPGVAVTVEVFGSSVCDGSGHGEGAVYAGKHTVVPGGGGSASFVVKSPEPLLDVGGTATATATDVSGTSELSACRTVAAGEPPPPPPPPPRLESPSFVVVLTDDQSLESISRTPAAMPWLQARLADPDGHWIRFTNAFAQVPMCCPSRANLLSGQYSHHTNVRDNSEGGNFAEATALPTWLDAEGYRTALIGKYLNNYPFGRGHYIPPGWDRWVGWEGPAGSAYFSYRVSDQGVRVPHGQTAADYSTDVYLGHALDFIGSTPSHQPFFLLLAPNAPHAPRTRAPRHATFWQTGPNWRTNAFNEADVSDKPAWVRALPLLGSRQVNARDKARRDQYGTLLAVDEALERLTDRLASKGRLDETIIAMLSDNGFSFGEHRWNGKGCPYEECVRVPFLMRYPGAVPHDETRLVSLVDLAPTLAELAGATPTHPVDGMSLLPLIEGTGDWREDVFVEWIGATSGETGPRFTMIRSSDFAYVEYPDTGEAELYDLTGALGPADPAQTHNLCPGTPPACAPAYAAVAADLAARLAAYRAS